MATHFVTYRPNSDRAKPEKLDRYQAFLSWRHDGKIEHWSATRQFQPGDLAIFYMASPLNTIVGVGVVDSDPFYEEPDNPADFKNRVYCDYRPVWFLAQPVPIKEAVQRQGLEPWWATRPYQSIRRIDDSAAHGLLREVLRLNPGLKSDMQQAGVATVPKPSGAPATKAKRATSVRPTDRPTTSTAAPATWKLQNLLDLTWVDFEHLVGELYRLRNRDCKVDVTTPQKDLGVDVVIRWTAPKGIEVVQCKRYRPSVKVTQRDMQVFVGSMTKFKATRGHFVTTSEFNRFAVNFADGLSVELIDGKKLLRMIADTAGFPAPSEFRRA